MSFANLKLLVMLLLLKSTYSQSTYFSCDGNQNQGMIQVLRTLQESIDKLTLALTETECHQNVMNDNKDIYPLITVDNTRWRSFWWFKQNTSWPGNTRDVLQDEFGKCNPSAPYCFGRLPAALREDISEMLGIDSGGNIYRWRFNSQNGMAHSAWRALHDHIQPITYKNGNTWMPTVLAGLGPIPNQDSFMYREEHGVRSLLMDDDNCDCYTSLSLGHGMCGAGFSTSYGPEWSFGVDLLHDTYCQTPNNRNGLTLYFRDDDDCINVTCPHGKSCKDGIYSYRCE